MRVDAAAPESAASREGFDTVTPGGPRTGRRWVAYVGAAAIGAATMWAAVAATGHRAGPPPSPIPVAAAQPPDLTASGLSPAIAAYERVAPAVVLVAARAPASQPHRTGFGSGVIFDPRGYIVTNGHVVGGGSGVTVTMSDGVTLPAEVVGLDPSTDLAVLRVHAGHPLPVATFATGVARPGETVVAIGNPLGPRLAQSATAGIVSGVRPILYGLQGAEPRVTRMIQTDAAINPGNSGGPLVNLAGRVIGITTVKVPTVQPGVAAAGLGFAITADTVRTVVDDLVRYGYVRRVWLGVRFGLAPTEEGGSRIVVRAVEPGGPAAEAGLRAGDVITAIGGRKVTDYLDLVEALGAARAGQRSEVVVERDGRRVVLRPTLTWAPRPGS